MLELDFALNYFYITQIFIFSPKRRNKLPRYNVANRSDSNPELQAQIRVGIVHISKLTVLYLMLWVVHLSVI